MSQNVAECLADMSARSPTCQRPEGGTDADMSADMQGAAAQCVC